MKKTVYLVSVMLAAVASADVAGEFNSWLGYLAGYEASGNRATFMGAGAGGGATDIYRTDYFGAAAGTYSREIYDSVGIGYRALRYSQNVSNVVAIGSHALEGVNMGGITDATWINGHFVANPPVYDPGSSAYRQTPGEFYITGDAALTNALAPIWYDGTNLHLRGYSQGGGGGGGIAVGNKWLLTKPDGSLVWLEKEPSYDIWGTSDGDAFGLTREQVWDVVDADWLWYLSFFEGNVPHVVQVFAPFGSTSLLFVDGTNTYSLVSGTRYALDTEMKNLLSGKTFDLSTEEGMVEAVSNIVTVLGGRISSGN